MPLLDNANWFKVALLLKGIPEEDTPTLLVHASADPEQVYLIGREAIDRIGAVRGAGRVRRPGLFCVGRALELFVRGIGQCCLL